MRPSILLFSLLLVCLPAKIMAADLDVDFVRGRVFYKTEGESPFSLKTGKLPWREGLTLLSFFDGQCFVKNIESAEIRLKEDSLVFFKKVNICEIRKGLVGIKATGAQTVEVSTPHAVLEMDKGTLVIKTCPILTRICVIDGAVMLKNPKYGQKTLIKAGHEVAAGSGMYSKLYRFTDELRYSWYWVAADQEPSLKLESE